MKHILFILCALTLTGSAFARGSLSIDSTNTFEFGWGLKSQTEGYAIQYTGFGSEKPAVFIVDEGTLNFEDAEDAIRLFSERYADCLDISVDKASRVIRVRPKKLFRVASRHVEKSTYEVDGKTSFTLETRNQTLDRFFCVYKPELIKLEWQKRAFLD